MAAYSVRLISKDSRGQRFVTDSTVVYASDEATARVLGAEMLRVDDPSKVVVESMGAAGGMNPDAQIIGRQTASGVEILNDPTQ